VTNTELFKHATPELYDRYMVPLLFEPYARVVADRVGKLQPSRILETAAGTGVLTDLAARAAPDAQLVATDINPGVVAFASERLDTRRVTVQQANAQDLPFEDDSFDLVLCQFGVMFFPDKVVANAEARRVLRRGGSYILVTFADLRDNPVPKAADEAVAGLFPDDPPRYMERGPFSYTDASAIEADLRSGGFSDVAIETTTLMTHVNARDAAAGMVLGSPFRAEIERRDPASLERALDAVTAALRPLDGREAPMSAHVATARG
jgi:ubiquinone/menaquinone biosynthesis C-methylase UbiE